jgi:hypothetical protein
MGTMEFARLVTHLRDFPIQTPTIRAITMSEAIAGLVMTITGIPFVL